MAKRKRTRRLHVYVHPNADGRASYAVAAYTRREAVRKMGGPRASLAAFDRDGGFRAPFDHPVSAAALASPGVVFRRPIEDGPPPHAGWRGYEPAHTEE